MSKITLPPASHYESRKTSRRRTKVNLRAVAEAFINIQVRNALDEAGGRGVNIAVPTEAYQDLKAFYVICQELLTPLGYKSSASHDGGGQYNTLYVGF